MSRCEDDSARAGGKLLVTDSERMLALDHVEELVLVRVHMKRSVKRVYLFDDREPTRSRLGAGLDEKYRPCERQALSRARIEVVPACTLISDSANLAPATLGVHRRTGRPLRPAIVPS